VRLLLVDDERLLLDGLDCLFENCPDLEVVGCATDGREAARLLGVSPGTIDNLRLRGQLASVKLNARRLFDVEDLRRLIQVRKGADQ